MTKYPISLVRWLSALWLFAMGCGSSSDPSDGGIDAGQDVAEDVAIPDEAEPDGFPDSGQDAAIDQAFHVIEDGNTEDGDAAPDVAADAVADSAVDDVADASAPEAPWPPQCGDGYRDPMSEECDDGLGTAPESRACTQDCEVFDRLATTASGAQQRWLASPGAIAAGPAGYAVVMVEHLEHPNDLEPRLAVALFDMAGRHLGVSHLKGVDFDVAPALAQLPSGDFALVVSQMGLDAEGLGLGLYRVSASGGHPEFVSVVNESAAYGQHGPSAGWSGTELVVAWLDDSPAWNPQASGRRVCSKRFGSTLAVVGDESCFDETTGWPSDLAIAAGASTAIAWREFQGYDDVIVVEAEGWRWQSPLLAPTNAFEPPAIAWLDGSALLIVATEGDGVQRVGVIDSGVELVAFEAVGSSSSPRFEPSVARTPDGIYMVWSEPEPAPNGGWSSTLGEVWLQKISWTGAQLDLISNTPIPLPRQSSHLQGDQHRPIVVAVNDAAQAAPGGAVLTCWNDLTASNFQAQAPHGDVAMQQIPTPIVRGPVY